MRKLIKQLFCKHKYMPYQYTDEPVGQGRYKRRHIWKCVKCGKTKG